MVNYCTCTNGKIQLSVSSYQITFVYTDKFAEPSGLRPLLLATCEVPSLASNDYIVKHINNSFVFPMNHPDGDAYNPLKHKVIGVLDSERIDATYEMSVEEFIARAKSI